MEDSRMTKSRRGKDPDEVIHELGGCGRFQIRMALMVHLMNLIIVWSLHSMVFTTAAPKWQCAEETLYVSNESIKFSANSTWHESCEGQSGSPCSQFMFTNDMRTIVSEWSLVCDKAWIPATINSIQIGCILLGNAFAGHLADAVGRKIPLFLSIAALIVFNLLAYFSVSWVMFATARAFTGAAAGLFLTVRYNFQSEFSLARWRPWLIGFPSWPIQACILALVLWILKNWRNIHLVVAILGVPFLATWWFLPESFRWYYAHDRIEEAEKVVTVVSKVNRRPVPDMTYMKQLAMESLEENKKDRMYTALDLFKGRFLIKVTFLLSLNWFALGLISYGINLGIQRLAGDIYLNMFLFPLVEIPAKFIALWLFNKIGRRPTSILVFSITAASTLIVGIVQYIATDAKDTLTNSFAMVANLSISTAWGAVQVLTVETYPTVVRNIGFGFCSVFARIGASAGPQLVFLETYVPGILYFCCGAVALLCVCGLLCLPETKDTKLSDKLNQTITLEKTGNLSV